MAQPANNARELVLDLPSMLAASAIYVIDGQELEGRLSATGAAWRISAVVGQRLQSAGLVALAVVCGNTPTTPNVGIVPRVVPLLEVLLGVREKEPAGSTSLALPCSAPGFSGSIERCYGFSRPSVVESPAQHLTDRGLRQTKSGGDFLFVSPLFIALGCLFGFFFCDSHCFEGDSNPQPATSMLWQLHR